VTAAVFRAGPASARVVYRKLRRIRVNNWGDVHLLVEWLGRLPGPVDDALIEFDMQCKTLRPLHANSHRVRTRCWAGRGSRAYGPSAGTASDKWHGRAVSRALAALLRAAHAHGVWLEVTHETAA
jgi:hypothetical protein